MINDRVKKINPEIERATNLEEFEKLQNTSQLMSVKEFREKGYLQELNRRFLHKLGLALSVKVPDDESKDEELFGIIDNRSDGCVSFDKDIENSIEFKKRIEFIDNQLDLFSGK